MNQNAMQSGSIKREPLAYQVASKIRQDIFTGKYKSGEKLPPEREIAEQIGVSRVTVRQALQELAREEWIDIVQGRGATVLDYTRTIGLDVFPALLASGPQAVVTPKTFFTMLTFSNWLYKQICISASTSATLANKTKLDEIIDGYTPGITINDYCRIESNFYYELLSIGDDFILQMFFNTYMKTFLYLVETGVMSFPPLPRDLYISYNKELTNAVCENRPDKIDAIIEKYKPEVLSSLIQSMQKIGVSLTE